VQTGKCLTIAGGESTANNVTGAAIHLRQPYLAYVEDQVARDY